MQVARCGAIAAAVLLLTAATPQPAASGKWAIVVGVDEYESPNLPPLRGAVADAKAISSALINYVGVPESQITLITSGGPSEPTGATILNAIGELRRQNIAGDLLIFFFAGHGREVDGEQYLLTYKSNVNSDGDAKETSLNAEVLMRELHRVNVRDRLVFIDACRDDPLAPPEQATVATPSFQTAYLVREGRNGASGTFLATQGGQSSYESAKMRRGFFSLYLELGLSGSAVGRNGDISTSSLKAYLEEEVPHAVSASVHRDQMPWIIVGGRLVLVTAEQLRAAPTARPLAGDRPVHGVVQDADGKPVRNVTVRVTAAPAIARSLAPITVPSTLRPGGTTLQAVTDDRGFFSIDGVPEGGDLEVRASGPGYADRALVVDAAASRAEIPIVVARPAAVAAADSPAAAAARAAELARVARQTLLAEDFASAEIVARAALDVDAHHALANAVLANALAFAAELDRSKLALAREHATRAVQADANLWLAYNARGLVAYVDGDLDSAQADFLRAIALEKASSVAHANLAQTYALQERYKDAEKAYRDAIRLQPGNAIPYNGLAAVLTARKKYRQAVDEVRNAIVRYDRQDRTLGRFYVNLAVALSNDKKHDQALDAVARAKSLGITADPRYQVVEAAAKRRR